MFDTARLVGKSAIITGGGTGIGEAICYRFSEEGAEIAVFDVDQDLGRKTADAINKKGGRALFSQVDVAQEDQVKKSVNETLERFGKIDILVNNAAVLGPNKLTHEVTVEEWDSIFAVNVRGGFLCIKHVIPMMIKARGGSIVNFSSIYGLVGNDDIPPYHATKGAVLAMTKTDAICYAKFGIRVNTIHPGTTLTPLVRKVGSLHPGGLDAYIEAMREKHPLCIGEPVDVANAALFLASEEARFVTGASLVVDGGYTAQ